MAFHTRRLVRIRDRTVCDLYRQAQRYVRCLRIGSLNEAPLRVCGYTPRDGVGSVPGESGIDGHCFTAGSDRAHRSAWRMARPRGRARRILQGRCCGCSSSRRRGSSSTIAERKGMGCESPDYRHPPNDAKPFSARTPREQLSHSQFECHTTLREPITSSLPRSGRSSTRPCSSARDPSVRQSCRSRCDTYRSACSRTSSRASRDRACS